MYLNFAAAQANQRCWIALTATVLLTLAQPGAAQAKPASPIQSEAAARLALAQPHPALTPKQVVALQLKALQQVDVPEYDAGITTVYRFASPENRSQTGPLPRFAAMLREGYPELLGHRSHEIAAGVRQGATLLLPVTITARTGQVLRYVFILRQQTQGALKGCWMTDGVVLAEDQPKLQEA
jgi:hypothetical protein